MARKIVKTMPVKTGSRAIPVCSVHKEAMAFNVAGGYWACTEQGCILRQYPQVELVQSGPAVVGTGPLELLLYKDDKGKMAAALRARGNNVVMDITPYLSRMFKPKDGETVIMLRVRRVVDTDGFTERDHEFD
jgi:hypothetical protein